MWWTTGVALWLCSLAFLVVSFFIGTTISRPFTFYAIEKGAFLPAGLAALLGGLWTLRSGLGASGATAFVAGLVVGILALPPAIRLRAKWRAQAMSTGHLRDSLNREAATWDPRYEMDQYLKDPRFSRPNCFLSLLFWGGPAIGLALVDIFGVLTATIIAGAMAAGLGYSAIMIATTDLVVLGRELRRLEKELGRRISLPPDFTRGKAKDAA
jgi:hypothetical protein